MNRAGVPVDIFAGEFHFGRCAVATVTLGNLLNENTGRMPESAFSFCPAAFSNCTAKWESYSATEPVVPAYYPAIRLNGKLTAPVRSGFVGEDGEIFCVSAHYRYVDDQLKIVLGRMRLYIGFIPCCLNAFSVTRIVHSSKLLPTMRRPYLAFIALGIVFIGFAVAGRSNLYYGVAAAFFIVAFIRKRRADLKK